MLSTYHCEFCGPFFEEKLPDRTKQKHRCGAVAKLISFREEWGLCDDCKTPKLTGVPCRFEH